LLLAETICSVRGLPGRSTSMNSRRSNSFRRKLRIATAAAWKAARRLGCGSTALRRIADLKSAARSPVRERRSQSAACGIQFRDTARRGEAATKGARTAVSASRPQRQAARGQGCPRSENRRGLRQF
jgi:hypothetical protein